MYSRAKVYGAADNIKPYVERAMTDEKLRGDICRAFRTANELYRELMSDRDEPVRIATRVATDDDVRDKLREAIEDLRSASDRLKGKPRPLDAQHDAAARRASRSVCSTTRSPGRETRRFIKDMLSGAERGLRRRRRPERPLS